MRRDQLEHAIRTACQIIGATEVFVIGSQSILGTSREDQLPPAAMMSIEIDKLRIAETNAHDFNRSTTAWAFLTHRHAITVLRPARPLGQDSEWRNISDTLNDEEGGLMSSNQAFWDDLARDLEDPEFLREYIVESMRIATVDAIVNELDEAREAAGLSKADLARAIQVEPATIRRLFAAERPNPTLGTLAEVAAALGMRIALEPLAKAERAIITEPLLRAKTADAAELARSLEQFRVKQRQMPT